MLTGWCLLGGGSRIVKVTSMVVPVMGIAYIGISLLVVIINIQNVPAMFVRILKKHLISKQFSEHFPVQP